MGLVVTKAPGKLNFTLEVVSRRTDGYHDLRMLMHAVDLEDTVHIETRKKPGILIGCTNPVIPCDEKNLAYKAAALFFEKTATSPMGLDIFIEKRIPPQAGMAGGSADAAAVLVGLDRLFHTRLAQKDLCDMGLTLGADVPFCITGGAAVVEGIGEKITPLPTLQGGYFTIAKPAQGMATAECFARFDSLNNPPVPDTDKALAALKRGDLPGLGESFGNMLEQAIPYQSVGVIKQKMLEAGALGSAMTGSGSAVFGLFKDKKMAVRCSKKLYILAQSVFVARPVAYGASVIFCD